MKVLIVSDTHGYDSNMYEVIQREEPFDMMVHCGDIESGYSRLRSVVDCSLHVVAGNNDFCAELLRTDVFRMMNHKVLLVHGHRQRVHYGLLDLSYMARENDADIVMFGHTHVPLIETVDGILFLNPGSLTYPRQSGNRYSYIVLQGNQTDITDAQIKYL